jgi:carbonic anhydrase
LTTLDGSLKSNENLKIEIVDHALKIRHDNFGKIVTLDGSLYTAQEIVFRTPAEHSINGKKFDMEMQIIHFGQTAGDIAKQVVLSFVFEKTPGLYNKFIDDIDFFTLPNPMSKSRDLENKIYIPKIFYNARDDDIAIMKPFSFYTYQGSLTAPPCTERTIVYVASEPIKLGTTAIQLFQEALRMPDIQEIQTGDIITSKTVAFNNRAVQNRNGRNIFYYDSSSELCVEAGHGKTKKAGHYERLDNDLTKYYYVTGTKPSGMPGAFVVSKNEAMGSGLLAH